MAYGWPKTLYREGDELVVETEAQEVAACAEGWKHTRRAAVAPEPEPDSPLDHDGKGGAGGSVKGYHSTARKGARRKRAKK